MAIRRVQDNRSVGCGEGRKGQRLEPQLEAGAAPWVSLRRVNRGLLPQRIYWKVFQFFVSY